MENGGLKVQKIESKKDYKEALYDAYIVRKSLDRRVCSTLVGKILFDASMLTGICLTGSLIINPMVVLGICYGTYLPLCLSAFRGGVNNYKIYKYENNLSPEDVDKVKDKAGIKRRVRKK